ncbi:MAG: hypothetical protein K2I08_02925 [Muribaculaceae bacterium]|nr:hypothetical protein [Muribaculaceae bacterium]MDE6786148.1 hypothetical protein [Muribaculaceae bacterium]
MGTSSKKKGTVKERKKNKFTSSVSNTVKHNTDTLRSGRAISLEFFQRNAWLIIAIITVLIGVMGLRYRTKTRMTEIKQLNKELQRAESDKLHEKAWYMTLIRETELTRLTTEKHLGLCYQEEPPIEIECEALNVTHHQ